MSSERFDGRTVALTGVGRKGQVGEAVARAFAARGAAVALLDRDAEVEQRAAELKADGFDARAFVCDLTDPAAAIATAAAVRERMAAELDALVNIAGGFAMSGPIADSDPSMLERQLSINLWTAYNATRAFLPLLRARKGAVVFFGTAAVLPSGSVARISAYAAAKSGVLALMRAVAEEERESGVRSNAVAPTAIRTGDNIRDMGEKMRYVEREEVAEAVLFLCSDAARPISGEVIRLG